MNKLDLKSILKALKLNESTISMVLGAIVIVVVGVLLVNYFREKGITLPGLRTEQPVITEKIHSVAKGETLWAIAEKYYGSGYNWVDIAKANNLANAGVIEVGQTLTIPDVEPLKPTTTIKADEPISGATYQVVRGDNLW
ncbi:MAG: LysM peptidoglycan-binding domain-containing protein, partial [Patescibacteria group bacterium]